MCETEEKKKKDIERSFFFSMFFRSRTKREDEDKREKARQKKKKKSYLQHRLVYQCEHKAHLRIDWKKDEPENSDFLLTAREPTPRGPTCLEIREG